MRPAAHLTLNLGIRGLTTSKGSVDPRGPNEWGSTCGLEQGIETRSTFELGYETRSTFDLELGDGILSTYDLELGDETRSTIDLELGDQGIDHL